MKYSANATEYLMWESSFSLTSELLKGHFLNRILLCSARTATGVNKAVISFLRFLILAHFPSQFFTYHLNMLEGSS